MKLLHFLNSIILFGILSLFLVSQWCPKDVNTLDAALVNVNNPIKKRIVRMGWEAQSISNKLLKHEHAQRVTLGIVVINGFSWILLFLFSNKRKDRISLEVNGGKVSITVLALEESLRRSLKGDPQIKDSKVIVNAQNRSVSVVAKVTLLETNNIHHLDENIIAHLKNHFEKIFPIQKPVSYEVVIRRLKPSGTPMGVQITAPVTTPTEVTSPTVEQPLYPDSETTEKE